jgi:hypothetical protein
MLGNLRNTLQIFGVQSFDKIALNELLMKTIFQMLIGLKNKQLELFNL